jgi:hypothetical protein
MDGTKKYRKVVFALTTVFSAVFVLSGCTDYSTKTTPSSYNPSKVNIPAKTTTESQPIRQEAPAVEDTESSVYEPQTFKGNDCTGDCSGHEAGYNWAEKKGITDPNDCGGNSSSFIEGCESYTEEQ